MADLCDDQTLQTLIEDMQADYQEDQIARVEALLDAYSEDARLHFLHGSMLITAGRLIEAHYALKRAVTLAPEFAIARFQLGFFQLTSGEADEALETWGKLDRLADEHYLRKFVDGLRRLIRDDFAGAIEALQQGIALNTENPPLSRDMQLIIDRCLPLLSGESEQAPSSETSMILSQFRTRGPMH